MGKLEGFVTTVGHIAWPITAIIVAAVARKEIKNLFAAITRRIEDKGNDISITKDGLEIKTVVAAQEARMVSLQAQQDQVKSIALRQFDQNIQAATFANPAGTIDRNLREMADEYMNINIADWSERTSAKNKAAENMAFYVVSNKISKEALSGEKHEGLLIALAEAITLSADNGDAERLIRAAGGATRLHVRFRVLIALTKLLEKNLLTLAQLGAVRELLKNYSEGADASLNRLISNVASLVNEKTHLNA